MTTPRDIITLALKDAGVTGVGQNPSAEDINDGFTRLNYMLAQWNRKRWLVWHLVDVSKVSTGASSYTVGPGLDFNVTTPERIEAAFLRQLNVAPAQSVDYPLQIIPSRENYNTISIKSLASFPSYVFYDYTYPTGVLYFWPIPSASIYELHITVKSQLSQFTGLTQNIVLPPEYMAALHYNLSDRLIMAYSLPSNPDIKAQARDALNVVRGANTQIPELSMPIELRRKGIYNFYSDQVY